MTWLSEFKKDKIKRTKTINRWKVIAIIMIAGCMFTVYYTVTTINHLPLTPEQVKDNIIRENYKTCGHKTIYDYPDNPFVYVKGNKRVYLKDGGCK